MTAIYDPARPPPIFDGLLDVYTTCRDCRTLMKVIQPGQHSHPTCATVQTQLESLADLMAAEVRREDWAQAKLTAGLMEEVAVLDIGSAAYEYAKAGWPVFPLATKSKAPAIPKNKGGKGFKQATTDPERIKRWWARHPDHNIGLATGHRFDVIDIDTKDADGNPTTAGIKSLMNLLDTHKIPPTHAIAVTASGGMHFYVKPTGKGNYQAIRPGVDYRGIGGYVVAPPSLLAGRGRNYTWLVEPSPEIKGES
jgi:hypothetical protein